MTRDRFLDYIAHEKRYSPHTITSYQTDLDQLQNYLADQYDLADTTLATHQMIRSWIVSLLENGLSPRSVNRKITTLKSYFRFLVKEKLIDDNPMSKILSPRTSSPLPVFVEEEQMQKLFEEVEFGKGFEAARDRLIIELLYHTGMRVSELAGLNDNDVDVIHGHLKVTGKRNKERIIPFTRNMGERIQEYQQEKITQFSGKVLPGNLFLTRKGKKIYPRLVYNIVNRYLSQVTTLSKRSPHVIRHTFATHMLNHGADLNAIKDILGHSNLSATQVYTHNTIEKLKTAYKLAHPRA
jgi:integrase/recombinase XerC